MLADIGNISVLISNFGFGRQQVPCYQNLWHSNVTIAMSL